MDLADQQSAIVDRPRNDSESPDAKQSKDNSLVAETSPASMPPTEKASNAKTSDWNIWAIALGHSLSAFLIGLDRTILATAVPNITSKFQSLDDVGWYASAFMLTQACFQLLFGKLYVALPIKWVYLVALVIFEIGSVICAAAPNSGALIAGRAVAGLGATGILSGGFLIVAYTVPLHQRPTFAGLLGGALGIGQSVAPTLGGVFTDRVTWRWCFWINLPLGAITFFIVLILVTIPNEPDKSGWSTKSFVETFDLTGTLLLIPWVICLLLALQWGGSLYSWNSWRIILLLVLFGVLFIIWVYVQIRLGDKATLPPRLISQRSMVAGTFFMFCLLASFFLIIYYIPIWFQAVSSITSSVAVLVAGFLTTLIGYYVPHMLAASALTLTGCVMAYFLQPDSSDAFWISSLVITGIGIGIGIQQPAVAAQAIFEGPDIALATSAIMFCQSLASSIFLCVGQNVFQTKLVERILRLAPGVNPTEVVEVGAADLHEVMEERYPDQMGNIINAYNMALRSVFLICAILGGLSIIGAVAMEWVSAKKDKDKKGGNKT